MAVTASFAAGNGSDNEVVPVVTAALYTAGNVMGGVIPLGVCLPESFAGKIQSLAIKFKASVAPGAFTVVLFSAPPIGTYNDKSAPVFNAADMASIIGVFSISAGVSPLGTMTVAQLDTLSHQIIGVSRNLWAVVVCAGAPTPASASDMSLRVSVVW